MATGSFNPDRATHHELAITYVDAFRAIIFGKAQVITYLGNKLIDTADANIEWKLQGIGDPAAAINQQAIVLEAAYGEFIAQR